MVQIGFLCTDAATRTNPFSIGTQSSGMSTDVPVSREQIDGLSDSFPLIEQKVGGGLWVEVSPQIFGDVFGFGPVALTVLNQRFSDDGLVEGGRKRNLSRPARGQHPRSPGCWCDPGPT